MNLSPGPLPLYHQLEKELRARIHAQEFSPGASLPTEEQIGEQYGVSRITVRRALDALIAQGLITRRRGVGSFVTQPQKGVRRIRLAGSLDEFLADAAMLKTSLISLDTVVAPPEAAEALGLEAGSRAVRLEIVTRLDEMPVGYMNIYFPLHVGALLVPADVSAQSPIIRTVERKLNLRVARAEQIIEPDHAGEVAAGHLGLDPRTPVLRVTRVYYTAFDEPIEAAFVRYHPDHYRYTIDYRAGGS